MSKKPPKIIRTNIQKIKTNSYRKQTIAPIQQVKRNQKSPASQGKYPKPRNVTSKKQKPDTGSADPTKNPQSSSPVQSGKSPNLAKPQPTDKKAGDTSNPPSADNQQKSKTGKDADKTKQPSTDKPDNKTSKPDQTKSSPPADKQGNKNNNNFTPARTKKPQTQNVEKKGNNLPSISNPKKSPAGNTGLGDKAKAATDPKKFAADQAKKAVTKAATKAATGAATKALGSTIGTAIGGPLGTVAGLAAGILIDFGIEVGEKMLKYVLAIIGIIVIFFVVLFFLILLAIASFFFSGGGGYSSHQESDVANQITPINSPVGNPSEVKTLQNAKSWYQKQTQKKSCHATAVAMYLTFLGFDTNEEEIRKITGDNVSFPLIQQKYNKYKLTKNEINTNTFTEDQTFIKDAIDKGKPVIIGVGDPIASTGSTHFLIITGYDSKNVYTNDPNEYNPNSQTWESIESATYPSGDKYHAYTITLD